MCCEPFWKGILVMVIVFFLPSWVGQVGGA